MGESRGLFLVLWYSSLPMSKTLADWLRGTYPQAKTNTMRRMLKERRLRINGAVARRLDQPIGQNDRVEVIDKPRVVASAQPLRIVFEDQDLLVVDKPAGLLTSTVVREKRATALAILRRYLAATDPRARLGLIHRLDKDACGLLVFSKNDLAYRSLKSQFFKHSVERIYVAITDGLPTPPAGRVQNRLVELPDGSVRQSHRPGQGETATTDYRLIAKGNGQAAARVELRTGRKHQIRVHLSQRGAAIVGDSVYNSKSTPGRLMLSAVVLGFVHPRSGQAMQFEQMIPKDFPIVGGRKISQLVRRVSDGAAGGG